MPKPSWQTGVQEPQQYVVADRSLEPKTGEDIFPVLLTCIYILLGTFSSFFSKIKIGRLN
jgi:hypothetical protein